MDIITDLTSQSVSYIVILQDICRKHLQPGDNYVRQRLRLWDAMGREEDWKKRCDPDLRVRLREVLWISNKYLIDDIDQFDSLTYKISKPLTDWLQKHFANLHVHDSMEVRILDVPYGTVYSTPDEWRIIIRRILYAQPKERLELAGMLFYMPIQVILALGGKNRDLYDQRVYQVWERPIYQSEERKMVQEESLLKKMLSQDDTKVRTNWWSHVVPELWNGEEMNTVRTGQAVYLLQNEKDLLFCLTQRDNPVPFETIFHEELDEITVSRRTRLEVNMERWETRRNIDPFKTVSLAEQYAANKGTENLESSFRERARFTESERFDVGLAIETLAGFSDNSTDAFGQPPSVMQNTDPAQVKDPMLRARSMKLIGLALSGGGIRSATFNLGVLQYLAERNILSNVDYLSTVSGGGYIGTWAASWIKRSGAVQKVEDRLNPKLSIDPMAEHVRPIRWLRMYSNYLTPNAGIMSVDSWTLGMTWIRNTLITQFLLLLLLCSLLSGIFLLFTSWKELGTNMNPTWELGLVLLSMGLPTIGCLVAGVGMHSYNNDQPLKTLFYWGKHPYLSHALIGIAIFSAFFISMWMYSNMEMMANSSTLEYKARLWALWPAAVVGAAAILLTAVVGRYYDFEESGNRASVLIVVVFSSVIAAGVGWVLMAGVWQLFPIMTKWVNPTQQQEGLLFLLGIPMVLEVFSIIVVVRMAIMGRLFPDARREWWGRMGAIAHRFSMFWILMCLARLFLMDIFRSFDFENNLQVLLPVFGGWAGIVGLGVKLAYSSTSDKDKGVAGMKEFFIRFVPYLFLIGFILGGCYLLNYITRLYAVIRPDKVTPIGEAVIVTAFFVILTLLLSWRVGVNEFSLHYFYRNRLVRAYLGATRRRAERSKTANSFTGLDLNDDEKLKSFRTSEGYFGPYPLLNTALNATSVTELDRQDRKAESFLFSPLYCGYDFSPTRSSSYNKVKGFEYAYRPTSEYGYRDGPSIGTAMAISGAAVSPNMGYHSTSATAFLLTIFNVRMGWWMGNPRMDTWRNSDPRLGLTYIVNDLIGKSNINSDYVCLSDGGHFDNMGLYELIRRRCTYIILSDAEEDQGATCEGLANAIRRCRIDFGTEIEIDTSPASVHQKCHVVKGKIKYPRDSEPSGTLIYIKTVFTGDESPDIKEYKLEHPAFPNEATGDQFFDESQFESYRQLGYHSLCFNNSKKTRTKKNLVKSGG